MDLAQSFAHLFIPRQSNNYKAKILHPSGLTILLLAIILFQNVLTLLDTAGVSTLGYAAQISPQEVIRLTNEKRRENGLSELKENTVLSQAALAKGQDMLEDNYWAHVAPDGTEPWAFFTNVGYKYRYAGENLARDFTNPNAAVDAWMASPSHKENMLSSKYHEIGVGVIEGDLNGTDTTLVVQFFGTKATDTLPAVPVAAAQERNVTPVSSPEPSAAPVSTPQGQISSLPPVFIANAQSNGLQEGKISPFQITRILSLGLIGLLSLVLIIDASVVARKRITRIAGRTFAHLSFMGMILAIILIARAGEIF